MKNALKRSISVFLAITIIFSSAFVGLNEIDFSGLFAVEAEAASSGTCGRNLIWTFDKGVLTISGTGNMTNYSDYLPPWDSLNLSIKSVVINSGVTSIGSSAFYRFTNITSVTIGDSVTTIGNNAFYYCYSITSVTIGDSVTSIGDYAFYYCFKLTSITLPDSVTSIGENAFERCSGLTSITLPNSVRSIGNSAFDSCNNLTSVTIGDSVTSIGDYAFYYCSRLISITIPDSVTSIGEYAFYACDSLVAINVDENNTKYMSVDGVLFNKDKTTLIQYPAGKNTLSYTIPDSVTSIGEYAFRDCVSLTAINVNENNTKYTSVDGVLFDKDKTTLIQYPTGKTTLSYTIPDSVTNIGDYAFFNCDSLISITIPDSVTSIGDWVFNDCDSLTSITIPDSVTSLGDYTFNECDDLVSIIIGNRVTSIGDYTFSGCNNLTSITIPDSVTSIGRQAFGSCISLSSITIPDSVTSIGDYAFCSCNSLTEVTIGNGVTSIGRFAFRECNSLTNVYYRGLLSDWNNISIGLYNESLINARVSHLCTLGDWIVDVEATCTEEGSQSKICVVCGGIVVTETISALGHSYSSKWTIDTEATCTTAGSKSHHCTRCDAKTDVTTISATDHNYSSWSTIDSPTCTDNGEKYRECYDCDYYEYDTISATGHSYSTQWTIDTQPTCDSFGYKSHHCTRCDAKSDVTAINPVEHKFEGWKTISKPSASHLGQQENHCTGCDYVDYRVICATPKLKSVTNTSSGVKFTWEKVQGAKTYIVYRKTGSGKWVQIAKGVKSTSYTDKTAKSGKTYKYTVKAVTEFDVASSYNSSGLKIKHLADPTLKTPKSTKKGVALNWSKVTGAQGYVIYYKTGSGSYKKLTTVKGNSKVKYTHTKAKKGKTYTYKIRAYDGKTYSAYSNAKKIKDKY